MKKHGIIIFMLIVLSLIFTACENVENHDGEAQIPARSSDFKGQDYKNVVDSFKKTGFTNIKLEKIEDLITGWLTKDGEVKEVVIGDNLNYSKGDWLPTDTEIIIRYHTFPEKSIEPEAETETETESLFTDEDLDELVEEATDKQEETGEILTVDNCEDLAFILLNKDASYEAYLEFANKYRGMIIEFDGSVDLIVNHDNYKTRYDILITAGDYNTETQIGPTFKFMDVGLYDLGLDSLSISAGMNVRIIAEVEEFNYNTGLFFLDPISVTNR